MYCIKVTEGRERIEIRKYSSAFLPSCVIAEPQKSGIRAVRRFVVPGYIFTIRKESKAVPVPEAEWRIIEALSDSHPSFMDENSRIVAGPLAGLEELVTGREDGRIRIQTSLLGEMRSYWIQVHSAAEQPASLPENPPAVKSQTKDKGDRKMEYTQEQIRQVLAQAASDGVHAAAKSAGVPWQTVLRWARAAGTQLPSGPAKPTGKKAKKTGQPAKNNKFSAGPDLSPLEIENAMLRERVASLESKIEKMKKAIADLM